MTIHIVLLSGGSGSRLWPLSNHSRSKQFLKVLRNDSGVHVSMVQRVFGQIQNVKADIDVTIATCENQAYSIRDQIKGDYDLVLEPHRRDTAPAIMLACAYLDLERGFSAEDTVIVMPIDSFADQEYFDKIVDLDCAVQADRADLVLLGVRPTYPSSKYGYIIPFPGDKGMARVLEFKEKPSPDEASAYIGRGGLWNCGVFGFKLRYLRELTKCFLDASSYEGVVDDYGKLPNNSFDYEVVEGARSVAVLPYSGTWKDLGTWNTLTEEMAERTQGRVVTSGNENVHVINETSLPMVVAGMKDSVVVATYDGVLVCSKEASAGIKDEVKTAAEARPMCEKRQWGEYRVIDSRVYDDEGGALTKELFIMSGKQLSYQRHRSRTEIWTIVSGEGEVVVDGRVTPVAVGSVLKVNPMEKHSVRAKTALRIIEVQIGHPLVEEDIERFGKYWVEGVDDL